MELSGKLCAWPKFDKEQKCIPIFLSHKLHLSRSEREKSSLEGERWANSFFRFTRFRGTRSSLPGILKRRRQHTPRFPSLSSSKVTFPHSSTQTNSLCNPFSELLALLQKLSSSSFSSSSSSQATFASSKKQEKEEAESKEGNKTLGTTGRRRRGFLGAKMRVEFLECPASIRTTKHIKPKTSLRHSRFYFPEDG